LFKALIEEWKIEQPFARVIDDTELNMRDGLVLPVCFGFRAPELELKLDFTHRTGPLGPARAVGRKCGQTLLEWKAGTVPMARRRQHDIAKRAVLERNERIKAPPIPMYGSAGAEEVLDERCHEHRLAGAAETGDGKID
jgi:hypothetical protein